MIRRTHLAGLGGLIVLAVGATAQSNDSTFSRPADSVLMYSSPSIGGTTASPSSSGDFYWRAHSGAAFMKNVEPGVGAVMILDGYREWIFDTDWSTSPDFYTRSHGPAKMSLQGGLEPSFLTTGFTSEVFVELGNSGLPDPGFGCGPPGLATGYELEITLATPLVLFGDGSSDLATTYFVPGGMSMVGGTCGFGDYVLQDAHSTSETMADVTGNGINPDGGFQLSGAPTNEPLFSMAACAETWSNNLFQLVADTGTGAGVETGNNLGGAMNGRYLDVSSGNATLGCEIRDLAAVSTPHVAIGALSDTGIPAPGLPLLGGSLLILPAGGWFTATSAFWSGTVAPAAGISGGEGVFTGVQLPIPATLAGTTLYGQGVVFNLTTFLLDGTNSVSIKFL